MPYIYILECADGSYYTGSTRDLGDRFLTHLCGKGANYTRKRLPVTLIYCEWYPQIDTAFEREKQIQGWSQRKKKALVARKIAGLIRLSRNYTEHGRAE